MVHAALSEPHDGQASAWYLAKGQADRPAPQLLNAGLAFAAKRGLEARYRDRFGGISLGDLSPARAAAEKQSVPFPIMEIANELIVASLLENGAGWLYVDHEPSGHTTHRGDWQFTVHGKDIFVEVKSLKPSDYGSGTFSRPRHAPRVQRVLKGAYKQLPEDDRATVVVLVADDGVTLDTPAGLVHGDIFQALFGETVIRFSFDGEVMRDPRVTPTFWNMYVQQRKNRRLGAVFGLEVYGLFEPSPHLYALHNPFALSTSALPLAASDGLERFYVDATGCAQFERGLAADVLWSRCRGGVASSRAPEWSDAV